MIYDIFLFDYNAVEIAKIKARDIYYIVKHKNKIIVVKEADFTL